MTHTQRQAIDAISDDTIREALLDIEHIEGLQYDVSETRSVTELRDHLVAWYLSCHDRHTEAVAGCPDCDEEGAK